MQRPETLPLPPLTNLIDNAVALMEPLDNVPNKDATLTWLRNLRTSIVSADSGGGGGDDERAALVEYVTFVQSRAERYKDLKNGMNTTHIQPLWYQMYLGTRGPLLINWNYGLHLTDAPQLLVVKGGVGSSSVRAAVLATASFHLRHGLTTGDKFSKETSSLPAACMVDTSLCGDQYSRLFRCCRIPHTNVDGIVHSSPTRNDVLLLRKGHMAVATLSYSPPPPAPTKYALFNPSHRSDVARNASIIEAFRTHVDSQPSPVHGNVATLTNGDRNRWAEVYGALWETSDKELLQRIAHCAFAITLDDTTPGGNAADDTEPEQWFHDVVLTAGSRPENRYSDLGVTFVVHDSGRVGMNMEHSWGDGSTMQVVTAFAHEWCRRLGAERPDDLIAEGRRISVSSSELTMLTFQHLGRFASVVEEARKTHLELAGATSLKMLRIRNIGSSDIKERCKTSPDAFLHAAMHLAQQRTFGDIRSTYASLLMKKFHHGRTETLRTVFPETQALAKAMTEKAPPAAVRQLAGALANAHSKRIQQCRSGLGYHRHFTSFKSVHLHTRDRLRQQLAASTTEERRRRIGRWLRAAEDVQRYWLDASGTKELASDYLSTSAIACLGVDFFSFGAVLPDGLGIGYSPFAKELRFSVAAFSWNKRVNVRTGQCLPSRDIVPVYCSNLRGAINDLFAACSAPSAKL